MHKFVTKIGCRLVVNDELDTDLELELQILNLRDGNDDVSIWIDKEEIIQLRDHLNKVIENETAN